MPRRNEAALVGQDAIRDRRPNVEPTRASVRTSTSCNLTPRTESRRFFFDRSWLVVDRLQQKLADLVRVVLGLAQAFVESVDDGAGVAPLQVIAHPAGELRVFLERAERRPERFLDSFDLGCQERPLTPGVTDLAAKVTRVLIRDEPQHAATIGTGEVRRNAWLRLVENPAVDARRYEFCVVGRLRDRGRRRRRLDKLN